MANDSRLTVEQAAREIHGNPDLTYNGIKAIIQRTHLPSAEPPVERHFRAVEVDGLRAHVPAEHVSISRKPGQEVMPNDAPKTGTQSRPSVVTGEHRAETSAAVPSAEQGGSERERFEQTYQSEREQCREIVIKEIDRATGPGGGWVVSPRKLKEVLAEALLKGDSHAERT